MARPSELVIGNCYFTANYHDNDLLLPYIETLIYRGVDEAEDGQPMWLFDYPDSNAEEAVDEVIQLGISDDHLYQVLDFGGLSKWLNGLSPLHPLVSPPPPGAVGINETAQRELRREIERFIQNPNASAVTVTIMYTDDALSISKKDGGQYEMGFFPNCLEDDTDQRICTLFNDRRTIPHVDYLASHGRTRVLEFAIPKTLEEIVELCNAVFTEIYAVRLNDLFRFSLLEK